jgi:hypothetical protein
MATQQPDDFNAWLAYLISLYVTAEEALLGGIAGILRFTDPTMVAQLVALARMRRLTQGVVRPLTANTGTAIDRLMLTAGNAGVKSAALEVRRAGGSIPPGTDLAPRFDFSIPHGERALQAIRHDLVSELGDVRRRITRLPDDVYKIISPATAGGQVIGKGYTPAQAQAYAWRQFAARGVTGFTDRSGREWSMSAYTEMSIRTATTRAFNASHLQVMQAAAIDYFTVTSDGHPCPLCFPWQGKILTDGPDKSGALTADATIEEATAAGLFHPNCRHTLLPVIPGITVLPKQQVWTPEHQQAYDLTQKQRRLELEIRKAKKTLEYASSPETRTDARADVRNAQAKMRQFINDTGFLRQSRREQPDLANDHLKLPVTAR